MTMRIAEGISGTWHYHLRDEDDSKPNAAKLALCGAAVMQTQIPLEYWDKTPPNYHLPEKWCATCERLAALGKR